MQTKFKKFLIANLALVCLTATYYFLLSVLKITCPFAAIFEIPCPTCGMTHAIIFLFKYGIKGYLTYNAFALPFAIAVLAEVNRFMFKKPIYVDVYAITVAVLNFVYYLLVNFI